MKQPIEEAKKEYYEKNYPGVDMNRMMVENAFEAGADWQSKQSPWISVNERLPEVGELVLCRMVSNGAIVSGYLDPIPGCFPKVATRPDFEFEDYGYYYCDFWMPIPSFDEILEANKDVLQRLKYECFRCNK